MKRKNNTLKVKASKNQLAKLNRLRNTRDGLILEAYISPVLMVLGLLGSQTFSNCLKWVNNNGFAPAPLADFNKTKNQIFNIRVSYLVDVMKMQKQAIEDLTTFSNNLPLDKTIKDGLKLTMGNSNPLNQIYMHVSQINKMGSRLPVKMLEEIKANYSRIVASVAAFSDSPLLRKYFSESGAAYAITASGMMNQGPLLQEIQKNSLIEITALLKGAYDDLQKNSLLDPDNLQKAITLSNGLSFIYALGGALILICLLIGTLFFTHLMEKLIHLGYKKWNQKSIVDADQVEKEINSLEAHITTLQPRANRVKTTRYTFLAITLLIGMYNASEKGPESFAVYFLMLNNLLHLFSEITGFLSKTFSNYRLDKKTKEIISEFDKAVNCTGVSWELVKGESFALSHLRFKLVQSNILSIAMMNQIVKNALFKNGVQIVLYEKNYFTVNPVSLSTQKINIINQKIAAEIGRYQAIKTVGQRVKSVFMMDYIKHIMPDESGLPTAVYQISHSNKSIKLESIKEIFEGCEVEQVGSLLFIKGHTLARETNQAESISSDLTDDKNPNEFLITSGARVSRKKQVKKQEQKAESSTIDEKSNSYERIEFPSGAVYDSRDPNCEVKKVNHPVFGKNHFILFRIPENAFASPADCKAVRNKIYEAEFATSAEGSQGLQFREGFGRDLTAPHSRMFCSVLRSKHLGLKLGDLRPVAETEKNKTGDKQLHVFKGINHH